MTLYLLFILTESTHSYIYSLFYSY